MITITILLIAASLLAKTDAQGEFTLQKTKMLKAVLPFFIILHHISQYLGIFTDFLYSGCYVVGLFFFISGYGLEFKNENTAMTIRSLGKRLTKIALPAIIPTICYIIVRYSLDKNFCLADYALKCAEECTYLIPSTWFLINLILFYIFYYLSGAAARNNKHLRHITLIILVAAYTTAHIKLDLGSWKFISNGAFIIGVLYKSYERQITQCLKKNFCRIITYIALLSSLYLAVCAKRTDGLLTANICLFTLAFIAISSKTSVKENRIVSFFSGISYEMFLYQGIILLAVRSMNIGMPYLSAALTIVITVISALISKKLTSAFSIRHQ